MAFFASSASPPCLEVHLLFGRRNATRRGPDRRGFASEKVRLPPSALPTSLFLLVRPAGWLAEGFPSWSGTPPAVSKFAQQRGSRRGGRGATENQLALPRPRRRRASSAVAASAFVVACCLAQTLDKRHDACRRPSALARERADLLEGAVCSATRSLRLRGTSGSAPRGRVAEYTARIGRAAEEAKKKARPAPANARCLHSLADVPRRRRRGTSSSGRRCAAAARTSAGIGAVVMAAAVGCLALSRPEG